MKECVCASRSMVVGESSILSAVKTQRAMASDSPARSLDEIDLSALRVNAPPLLFCVCTCVCVCECVSVRACEEP